MVTHNKNLGNTIEDKLGLYDESLISYLNKLEKIISN